MDETRLHAPSWRDFSDVGVGMEKCDYRFMAEQGETCARVPLSSFSPQLEVNSFPVLHKGKSDDLESFCDMLRNLRGTRRAIPYTEGHAPSLSER